MNIVDRDSYWAIQEALGSVTISAFISINFPRHKRFVHKSIKEHFMETTPSGKFKPREQYVPYFKGRHGVYGIRLEKQQEFIAVFTVAILDDILGTT